MDAHQVGSLEWFFSELNLEPQDVTNIYLTGSRVYGTATSESDWDFICVVRPSYFTSHTENMIDKGLLSAVLYDTAQWKVMLFEHHPTAVVAHYTPKQFVLKEDILFPFELNISRLKFSWLRKVSSCFHRAKSVYHSQADYKRMKKMMVHSFRCVKCT